MTALVEFNLINDVINRAKEFGFQVVPYKHEYGQMALQPLDDEYPIYSRDAQFAVGTFEQISVFLRGMEFMKSYYQMIKATNDDTISKKEQAIRNKKLMYVLADKKEEIEA